jgi:hypothetical protein
MSSEAPERPVRQTIATILGVITALCTVGWYGSFAVMSFELKHGGFDGPPFYPGIIAVVGLVLTLPLALLCGVVALLLIGPRGSKLAWISLLLYLVPLLCGIIVAGLLKLK